MFWGKATTAYLLLFGCEILLKLHMGYHFCTLVKALRSCNNFSTLFYRAGRNHVHVLSPIKPDELFELSLTERSHL